MAEAERIYQKLIAPIEEQMMRVVGRLVRDPDEAADAFQNALLKVWKNLGKIDRHPNPHGYILRMCATAAYDVLRKRSRRERRNVALEEGMTAAADDAPHAMIVSQQRQAVLDSIAKLPFKQATAVLLRVNDEQSFEAIAQIMNCSEATARSNYSKGMARLRKLCTHLKH